MFLLDDILSFTKSSSDTFGWCIHTINDIKVTKFLEEYISHFNKSTIAEDEFTIEDLIDEGSGDSTQITIWNRNNEQININTIYSLYWKSVFSRQISCTMLRSYESGRVSVTFYFHDTSIESVYLEETYGDGLLER